MTSKNNKLAAKIATRRKKLIRACLNHDKQKQTKQRLKLFKLFVRQQSD